MRNTVVHSAQTVIVLAFATLLLAACSPATDTEQATTQATSSEEAQFRPRIRFLVEHAAFPVAMALAPDGRLFYTEKGGSVRLVGLEDTFVQPRPVITLPTDSQSERGMLGIAIDPNFEDNHYIWVYHTAPPEVEGGPSENRIVRFVEDNGIGTHPEIAFSLPIPGRNKATHNGGNIHFGPDGMLYVTIGDYENPANAQDMNTMPGKIHRFTPDIPLGIPDDNPFPGSSIYAYGLRNPFDFTFDPLSGNIFATENGPGCDDEVNLIIPGGNYGWQEDYKCNADTIDASYPFEIPMTSITPSVGITGITVYSNDEFELWDGKLLFCAWNTGKMYLATLNDNRDSIVSKEEVSLNNRKCQTDVMAAPDGRLYFASATNLFSLRNPALAAFGGDIFELGGQTHGVTDTNIDILRDAGMEWVKIQHQWQPGELGTDVAGRIFAAQKVGFRVLINITGQGHPAEIDFEEYVDFVAGVASVQPDAIEIWSGMNLEREWPAGQISAQAYVENMLRPSFERIKSIDPYILVISGGLSPTGAFGGCTDIGCDDDVYIKDMVTAGAEQYMDCVGIQFNAGATSPSSTSGHPFDGGEGHYSWYYSRVAELYRNTFSRPLCFTSLGYLSPEGYGQLPEAFLWAADTTVVDQAEWLAETVALVQNAGNVRMLIVYNVDFTSYGEDPQAGYAILRPDGTCPACRVLAEQNQ